MFTLDQTDCKLITAPLSLSLFLASQVTSFSQLRCFPHHHHRPLSTRKPVLDHPLRSPFHFSPPTDRFTHTPLKLTHPPLKLTHINRLIKISACARNSTPVTDRLISAAIYTIPFIDGIGYGVHSVPPHLYPPIYHLYNSSPFPRLAVLIIIQFFVLRNPKLRKYVRLNAWQATFLGFLLQVPSFVLRVISPVWPVVARIGWDLTFLLVVFGVIYIMVNTILGKTPHIPYFTDNAILNLR